MNSIVSCEYLVSDILGYSKGIVKDNGDGDSEGHGNIAKVWHYPPFV